MKLNREFFREDPDKVAKDILGKKLVVISRNQKLEGIIAATSAYYGEPKRKLKCLYADAGELYITTISGCKKFVIGTESRRVPSVITIDKIMTDKEIIGSKGLCAYFGLDKENNGEYVGSDYFWIEGEKSNFALEEHDQNASENCTKRYQLKI